MVGGLGGNLRVAGKIAAAALASVAPNSNVVLFAGDGPLGYRAAEAGRRIILQGEEAWWGSKAGAQKGTAASPTA